MVAILPVRAATPGIFRGTLVRGPARPGWIYVQGRNQLIRPVDASRAHVSYQENIPTPRRKRNPAESLVEGVEVRVMAVQDGHGDWRATEIEILKLRPTDDSTVQKRKT